MDNLKLLGMQRAEFELAKTFSKRNSTAQFFIIVFTISTLLCNNEKLIYIISILNLITGILWQFFLYKSKNSHSIAEKARRIVVLSDGLGIKVSKKLYSDILIAFSVSEDEGKKFEDKNYFTTNLPYGEKKLLKILEESAFWSKHLFKICFQKYLFYSLLVLILSIISLLIIPLLNNNSFMITIAKVACLLLTWFVTGNLFITTIDFNKSYTSMTDIESQLNGLATSNNIKSDILIIYGDYNAIVEKTPVISTSVYIKNKAKLNQLWKEREQI